MSWCEPFQSGPTVIEAAKNHEGEREEGKRVIMEYDASPSVVNKIMSVDDYEYSAVYGADSEKALSAEMRNKLLSQRPMDWATLPPESARFQAGVKETFENATHTVPDDAKPYQDINGGSMAPPDTDSMEMREREMLQTYAPKPVGGDMTTYDGKDVDDLIRRIYDKKGLIPTVAHKKDTNVYEVVGVRRKDDKVVYEGEEAPAATGPVQKAGEATITVPAAAVDMAASNDPYYDTTPKQKRSWDYQAWTPGLERMFAPTEPKQSWY
jgi:hypothetical protein